MALGALILSPAWTAMPAKAEYKPSFNSGRIPKDMTATNVNGLAPVLECYAAGYTTDGWTVDRVGLKGYCAVSPTHTRSGEASENSLLFPELEIAGDEWLKWDAISVAPDFPESYKVVARTDDGATATLFETDGENGTWTTRMISLSAYAGRKVSLEFVCTSVNRFMLAINSISVGAPSSTAFYVTDTTPRFIGFLEQENASVTVSATNTGATASVARIECTDNTTGEVIASADCDGEWPTGEQRRYELGFPLGNENRRYDYTVAAVMTDGETKVALSENFIYASPYAKRLLVDKGTGMWCQNCPRGILELESLERQLGEAVVAVDTHSYPDQDPLANTDYWNGLGFYAAPFFMLDRRDSSKGENTSAFSKFYDTPANFKIDITGISLEGNEEATVTTTVKAAYDTDNGSGRFRIGYVLTADFHEPDNRSFMQQNNTSNPSGERFYFMPSRIPADLMTYHDVSLTAENAFNGFEGSLPEFMEAGNGYDYSWKIKRPELLDDLKNGRVAAYVIDTESKTVDNTTARLLAGGSGIGSIADDSSRLIEPAGNGRLRLNLESGSEYRLEVFDASGKRVFSRTGNHVCGELTDTGLDAGIYVATVSADCGFSSCRIIIR